MFSGTELLGLTRGGSVEDGIQLIKATSAEPHEYHFKLIGTEIDVDADLFRIPVDMYPICKGDEFVAYPISGVDMGWAILAKLTGSGRTGVMTGSHSCRVDGVAVEYGASKVITSGLREGTRVMVTPTMEGGKIKYILTAI